MPSKTNHLKLDEVIARLSGNVAVEAVLVMGSAARGELTASSDYDVCVILSSRSVPIWLAVTEVDNRFSEFYFVLLAEFEGLVAAETPLFQSESREALLAHWLLSGQLAFDRQGRLAEIRGKLQAGHSVAPYNESQLYSDWFRLNYNLHETRRLLLSAEPVELMTFDLRVLFYGLTDLWYSYFRFRQLTWRGIKASIRYLEAHDLDYLQLFRRLLAENDRQRKLELYEQLARHTAQPFRELWEPGATAVELTPEGGQHWQPGMLEEALGFWQELIKTPD